MKIWIQYIRMLSRSAASEISFPPQLLQLFFEDQELLAVEFAPDLCPEVLGEVEIKELRRFEGHASPVTSVCFSPDGRLALSGSKDHTLRLWEVACGRNLRRFKEHTDRVNSVCFSSNGRFTLSGNDDRTARLWEVYYPVKTKKEIHPYPILSRVKPVARLGMERKEAGELLISAGESMEKGSFQEAYRRLRERQSIPGYERDREGMALLNLCGVNGKARRIGLIGAWPLSTFEGHSAPVNSVCFSSDGLYTLSGSEDRTVRLWEVESGKELKQFVGHTREVKSVCFSPNGDYALSAGGDKTILLWEVESGRELKRFVGHTAPVNSVCFSPDSRYVLSGSEDHTVRLWEIDWDWEY